MVVCMKGTVRECDARRVSEESSGKPECKLEVYLEILTRLDVRLTVMNATGRRKIARPCQAERESKELESERRSTRNSRDKKSGSGKVAVGHVEGKGGVCLMVCSRHASMLIQLSRSSIQCHLAMC
jgi:hypothetical protein